MVLADAIHVKPQPVGGLRLRHDLTQPRSGREIGFVDLREGRQTKLHSIPPRNPADKHLDQTGSLPL
jgi:hypothetical protein